jgi:hypothetical protein
MQIASMSAPIINAAQLKFNVQRQILVSSVGVGDSWTDFNLFFRPFLRYVLGKVFDDKLIQEDLLKNSGCEFIIVRPSQLLDKPGTGKYFAGPHLNPTPISRADVADFVIKNLEAKDYLGQTPTVSYSSKKVK